MIGCENDKALVSCANLKQNNKKNDDDDNVRGHWGRVFPCPKTAAGGSTFLYTNMLLEIKG